MPPEGLLANLGMLPDNILLSMELIDLVPSWFMNVLEEAPWVRETEPEFFLFNF